MAPPILILHIGWTREYQGAADDPVLGTFGAIRSGTTEPNEATNFKIYRGRCYGYAPKASVNLRRLGAPAGADHVDGVLVIFTATDTDGSGRYVVGWQHDARVFAELDQRRPDPQRPYAITRATANQCHLVPVDGRTFFIPAMRKGWPGIASTFYPAEYLSPTDLKTLRDYANGMPSTGFGGVNRRATPTAGRTSDPEHNALVEERAVDLIKQHYKDLGYEVGSVEDDNVGWDLEASSGAKLLRIEVKGCSGTGAVELTPNEYGKMTGRQYRMSYRLAIVHNALGMAPRFTIFFYSPADKGWRSDGGVVLCLQEKTAALASF